MRLEDLTIALRPRLPWEAVDLGCALVRRDYGGLLSLWAITVMPLWTLLGVLLWEHPIWFGVIAWWLKPLYGRVPLFYLSRAAFGATPTIKETLRQWPRLWSRFLISALLLRRLSFIRSFALPVWMLEGQRGKSVGKRVKSLAIDGGSSGASLTWVFVKLEIAAWLGFMALASTIGPSSGLPDWGEIFQNPDAYMETSLKQQWFSNILYLLAMTLIEPFYVGAGFGLYLNSRIKIEGWDIELVFRRLAARLRPVVVALMALGLFLPGGMMAQQPSAQDQTQGVEAVLKNILDHPDFKEHSRTQRVWVPDDEKKTGGEWSEVVGYLLMWLFYIIAFALLAFVLIVTIRWLIQNKHLLGLPKAKAREVKVPDGPRVVMGLDIARESLPEDIVAAARGAWFSGQIREALSLLYRGSLSRLVDHQRLPIRDSDTEDDCLMQVAKLGDDSVTDFFRQLTLIWVRAAYAGHEAQEHEFDQLCRTWPFSKGPVKSKQQRLFTSAALCLMMLPWMTGCSGHWEDLTIPMGYRGKARLDPFLAAQQLLEEYGHHTERLLTFKTLPYAEEGVILLSAEAGMPEARASQLLEWTMDGGHLIYAMAGCSPYNDWGLFSSLTTFAYAGNEDRADPILEKLGVKAENIKALKELTQDLEKKKEEADEKEDDQPLPAGQVRKRIQEPEDVPTKRSVIEYADESFEVDFPDMLKLSLERELRRGEYATGNKDQATSLSLHYGAGRVTLLNHARPLRNRYLDENDHARWLLALVGEEYREVHFLVSLQRSFWSLLWQRAWMPLTGLALVTLVWLWMHMPRFGPMRQVELHDTKHFADHIGALGQFFYRLNRPEILLSAAADAVRAKAIRLHPQLLHRDDEAIVDLLTERCQMPRERIRAAFFATGKTASHEMVRRLQDLQALKAALW